MGKLHCAALAALMAFACNSTFAAPSKESGFYLGGTLGITEFDDDGAFSGLNFDDSDNSFIVNAGYKFIPYFAVEGRVGDLGSYAVNGFGFSVDVISAHAVGIIPFGESSWELFGQLGLGNADIDCSGCSDETVGSAGVGVRFSPTPNLGISLQVDAWAYEDDSLGFQDYDISVASTQLGITYVF